MYGIGLVALLDRDAVRAKEVFGRLTTGDHAATQDPMVLTWSHIYLARIYDDEGQAEAAKTEYQAALAVTGGPEQAKQAAQKGAGGLRHGEAVRAAVTGQRSQLGTSPNPLPGAHTTSRSVAFGKRTDSSSHFISRRRTMRVTLNTWITAGTLRAVGGHLFAAPGLRTAQGAQPNSQSAPATKQPAGKDKEPTPPPLSMDAQPPAASPAASPEEDAAFKAFEAVPPNEIAKRIPMAEQFLQKYPQSRYRPSHVPSTCFRIPGEAASAQDAGRRRQRNRVEPQRHAGARTVVAQTIARTYNAQAPDAVQQLDKAEQYSKRAIEVTPTLTKPAELSDEQFNNAKNNALEMAYSGLGLVYLQKGKYSDAIPALEQSIKADTHPQADPVN